MTRIRPFFRDARPGVTPRKPTLPVCTVCEKEVPLETARADEQGRAIHEACYLLRLQRRSKKLTDSLS